MTPQSQRQLFAFLAQQSLRFNASKWHELIPQYSASTLSACAFFTGHRMWNNNGELFLEMAYELDGNPREQLEKLFAGGELDSSTLNDQIKSQRDLICPD